jgi:hypothetical protein
MDLKNMKSDLAPKSAEHIIRLVLGTLMVAGGILSAILHYIIGVGHPWALHELILVLALTFGGMGFLFTKTALELLKAVPLPFGKK